MVRKLFFGEGHESSLQKKKRGGSRKGGATKEGAAGLVTRTLL